MCSRYSLAFFFDSPHLKLPFTLLQDLYTKMTPVKETMDYYAILNVSQLASFQEIKKAYHRLALLYHPDKNDGSATSSEMFKKVLLLASSVTLC